MNKNKVDLLKVQVGENYVDILSGNKVLITHIMKADGKVQIIGKMYDPILKEFKEIEISKGQLIYDNSSFD